MSLYFNERGFLDIIDEIPVDHPTANPIQPSCDFLCHIAEQDIARGMDAIASASEAT